VVGLALLHLTMQRLTEPLFAFTALQLIDNTKPISTGGSWVAITETNLGQQQRREVDIFRKRQRTARADITPFHTVPCIINWRLLL
jgi:hypothetical protein